MFYYIIPALIIYVKDINGKDTGIIESMIPSITISSLWVGDCVDGLNYLIKTQEEVESLTPILENTFDDVVTAIGFDPTLVKLWNGGW